MLKHMGSTIAAMTIGITALSANAATSARWECQGIASTGEKVYLNLDSIGMDQRKSGYFFMYSRRHFA